jgi:hypothetical protein
VRSAESTAEQGSTLENLAAALVEEFLVRKDMSRTLTCFREERGACGEVNSHNEPAYAGEPSYMHLQRRRSTWYRGTRLPSACSCMEVKQVCSVISDPRRLMRGRRRGTPG